jgi:hypothetical protein
MPVAPRENPPIDLLAVTGAKGVARRYAAWIALAVVIIIALIIWLIVA